MQIIIKNDRIYLEFYSQNKLRTKSLNLPNTKKNLSYATKTLLPLFKHLATLDPVLNDRENSSQISNFYIQNLTPKSSKPNSKISSNLSQKIKAKSLNSSPNFTKNFTDFYSEILGSNFAHQSQNYDNSTQKSQKPKATKTINSKSKISKTTPNTLTLSTLCKVLFNSNFRVPQNPQNSRVQSHSTTKHLASHTTAYQTHPAQNRQTPAQSSQVPHHFTTFHTPHHLNFSHHAPTQSHQVPYHFHTPVQTPTKRPHKLTTKQNIAYFLKRFFDFCPDLPIQSYTPSHFAKVIAHMSSSGLAPSTIKTLFTYPRLAFKHAKATGLIAHDPTATITFPPAKPPKQRLFTPKEIATLLSHATGELRIFLYIAFFTGARSGEILALRGFDIDLETSLLTISQNQTRLELTTPKGGESRDIILPAHLKSFLKRELLPAGRIFTKDYFKIYYEFRKLLLALGLAPRGLHTTRHTYASLLLTQNTPKTLVAQLLGHRNLSLVDKVYGHHIKTKNDMKILNHAFKAWQINDNIKLI